jgi:uncharacterized membrane protein YjgN (DUF898 family)
MMQERPLGWDAARGGLAWLAFGNGLLTLLTLGTYRFWASARMRRAIWSRLSLFGDRLEYTGTGWELFRGVLRGMLLLLPLVLLLMVATLVVGEAGAIPLQVAVAAGTFLLTMYAIFAARRYLAGRTTWRGVRFVLRGSGRSYMWLRLRLALLLAATLGFAYPWTVAAETRWTMNNLQLGTEPFHFDGQGRALLRPFLATLAVNGLLLVPLFALAGHWPAWLALAPYALLLMVFGPGWLIFEAAFLRWRAAHTTLAGARFALPGASIGRVARLGAGNLLIIVASLTLLAPLATARRARFHAEHLRCDRPPELSGIGQVPAGAATDEGLRDLLSPDPFAI